MHGGAGGIGTFAIQLAAGARRAGAHDRRARRRSCELCAELGADVAINYRDEDFVEVVKEADGGADVILDNMGATYLGRNVDALATEGRLVVIGMQGGTKGELDLGMLLRKRGAVIATALRARPVAEKAAICASVVEHVWPLVADGPVRPVVHATMPLAEAAEAHQLMEAGEHIGKILLTDRPVGWCGMSEQTPSSSPSEQQVMVIGPDGSRGRSRRRGGQRRTTRRRSASASPTWSSSPPR